MSMKVPLYYQPPFSPSVRHADPATVGESYLDCLSELMWERLGKRESELFACFLAEHPFQVGSICSGSDAFTLFLDSLASLVPRFLQVGVAARFCLREG